MSEVKTSHVVACGKRASFFTIGHSTRTIPEFAEILRYAGVQLVVDVRSIRRSRTNPQYNEEALATNLEQFQIGYVFIPELGGRRSRQQSIDQELNGFWNNRSFHNYADYALTQPFREGLDQLLDIGTTRPCAIMCAEAVWWRCHRRIIADYLLQRQTDVFHLMEVDKIVAAGLTKGARVNSSGSITYPCEAPQTCCC